MYIVQSHRFVFRKSPSALDRLKEKERLLRRRWSIRSWKAKSIVLCKFCSKRTLLLQENDKTDSIKQRMLFGKESSLETLQLSYSHKPSPQPSSQKGLSEIPLVRTWDFKSKLFGGNFAANSKKFEPRFFNKL